MVRSSASTVSAPTRRRRPKNRSRAGAPPGVATTVQRTPQRSSTTSTSASGSPKLADPLLHLTDDRAGAADDLGDTAAWSTVWAVSRRAGPANSAILRRLATSSATTTPPVAALDASAPGFRGRLHLGNPGHSTAPDAVRAPAAHQSVAAGCGTCGAQRPRRFGSCRIGHSSPPRRSARPRPARPSAALRPRPRSARGPRPRRRPHRAGCWRR